MKTTKQVQHTIEFSADNLGANIVISLHGTVKLEWGVYSTALPKTPSGLRTVAAALMKAAEVIESE